MSSYHRTMIVTGVVAASAMMVGTTGAAPGASATEEPGSSARAASVERIASGLDNVRQLSVTPGGRLLVAEAGHGKWRSRACRPGAALDMLCFGLSGRAFSMKVTGRDKKSVLKRMPSVREASDSYSSGLNGIDKAPNGSIYATVSSMVGTRPSIAKKLRGKLIKKSRSGKIRVVANPVALARRHNWLGRWGSEATDVIALRGQVLVLDADAGVVLRYRKGRLTLWHKPPQAPGTPSYNAARASAMSIGADGYVYVVVRSIQSMTSRVVKLHPNGRVLRTWEGLPRATAATATANGQVWLLQDGTACGRPTTYCAEGVMPIDASGKPSAPVLRINNTGTMVAAKRSLFVTRYPNETKRPMQPGRKSGRVLRINP
ncbi:ScyD/ScyE family protein [Mumia sp. Pv 4-285]|uniref:ScyD/ScyE family protein n=1 Tax=Mumia qirimensis TaxID=3234852 RepID=UPI00351D5B1E